jgi:hypothetical protein
MKGRRVKITWMVGLLPVAVVIFLYWDSILMGVAGNFAVIVGGIPSEQDVSDAREVYQTIASHHHFNRSLAALPGRAPVFDSPGSHSLITVPMMVAIYFVTNREDQDTLIGELEELRKIKTMKPIKIMFYSEENWKTSGPVINTAEGPAQGGERGPERPIREVTIK